MDDVIVNFIMFLHFFLTIVSIEFTKLFNYYLKNILKIEKYI